jgi:uncharacterized protein with HEPN domain
VTWRAWKAIEEIFTTLSEEFEEKKNVLRWRPLKLLRQRALRRYQRISLLDATSLQTDIAG